MQKQDLLLFDPKQEVIPSALQVLQSFYLQLPQDFLESLVGAGLQKSHIRDITVCLNNIGAVPQYARFFNDTSASYIALLCTGLTCEEFGREMYDIFNVEALKMFSRLPVAKERLGSPDLVKNIYQVFKLGLNNAFLSQASDDRMYDLLLAPNYLTRPDIIKLLNELISPPTSAALAEVISIAHYFLNNPAVLIATVTTQNIGQVIQAFKKMCVWGSQDVVVSDSAWFLCLNDLDDSWFIDEGIEAAKEIERKLITPHGLKNVLVLLTFSELSEDDLVVLDHFSRNFLFKDENWEIANTLLKTKNTTRDRMRIVYQATELVCKENYSKKQKNNLLIAISELGDSFFEEGMLDQNLMLFPELSEKDCERVINLLKTKNTTQDKQKLVHKLNDLLFGEIKYSEEQITHLLIAISKLGDSFFAAEALDQNLMLFSELHEKYCKADGLKLIERIREVMGFIICPVYVKALNAIVSKPDIAFLSIFENLSDRWLSYRGLVLLDKFSIKIFNDTKMLEYISSLDPQDLDEADIEKINPVLENLVEIFPVKKTIDGKIIPQNSSSLPSQIANLNRLNNLKHESRQEKEKEKEIKIEAEGRKIAIELLTGECCVDLVKFISTVSDEYPCILITRENHPIDYGALNNELCLVKNVQENRVKYQVFSKQWANHFKENEKPHPLYNNRKILPEDIVEFDENNVDLQYLNDSLEVDLSLDLNQSISLGSNKENLNKIIDKIMACEFFEEFATELFSDDGKYLCVLDFSYFQHPVLLAYLNQYARNNQLTDENVALLNAGASTLSEKFPKDNHIAETVRRLPKKYFTDLQPADFSTIPANWLEILVISDYMASHQNIITPAEMRGNIMSFILNESTNLEQDLKKLLGDIARLSVESIIAILEKVGSAQQTRKLTKNEVEYTIQLLNNHPEAFKCILERTSKIEYSTMVKNIYFLAASDDNKEYFSEENYSALQKVTNQILSKSCENLDSNLNLDYLTITNAVQDFRNGIETYEKSNSHFYLNSDRQAVKKTFGNNDRLIAYNALSEVLKKKETDAFLELLTVIEEHKDKIGYDTPQRLSKGLGYYCKEFTDSAKVILEVFDKIYTESLNNAALLTNALLNENFYCILQNGHFQELAAKQLETFIEVMKAYRPNELAKLYRKNVIQGEVKEYQSQITEKKDPRANGKEPMKVSTEADGEPFISALFTKPISNFDRGNNLRKRKLYRVNDKQHAPFTNTTCYTNTDDTISLTEAEKNAQPKSNNRQGQAPTPSYTGPVIRLQKVKKTTRQYQLVEEDIKAYMYKLQKQADSIKNATEIKFLSPCAFNNDPSDYGAAGLFTLIDKAKKNNPGKIIYSVLNLEGNHYISCYLYFPVEASNKPSLVLLDPACYSENKSEKLNAVIDAFSSVFKYSEEEKPTLITVPLITQQLDDSTCGYACLQNGQDLIEKGILTVKDAKLQFHPEELTIHGEHYVHDNLNVDVRDLRPNELKSLTEKLNLGFYSKTKKIRAKYEKELKKIKSYHVLYPNSYGDETQYNFKNNKTAQLIKNNADILISDLVAAFGERYKQGIVALCQSGQVPEKDNEQVQSLINSFVISNEKLPGKALSIKEICELYEKSRETLKTEYSGAYELEDLRDVIYQTIVNCYNDLAIEKARNAAAYRILDALDLNSVGFFRDIFGGKPSNGNASKPAPAQTTLTPSPAPLSNSNSSQPPSLKSSTILPVSFTGNGSNVTQPTSATNKFLVDLQAFKTALDGYQEPKKSFFDFSPSHTVPIVELKDRVDAWIEWLQLAEDLDQIIQQKRQIVKLLNSYALENIKHNIAHLLTAHLANLLEVGPDIIRKYNTSEIITETKSQGGKPVEVKKKGYEALREKCGIQIQGNLRENPHLLPVDHAYTTPPGSANHSINGRSK